MEKFIKKISIYEYLLAAFSVIYTIYFTVATFLKYDNYYTGRFDLGNMAQTVWNSAHGNLFMLTDPNGTREVSRLAVHADFILILLAPFYLLWQDPRTLLFIQTVVLSAGGVFVYLIAQKILNNKLISLVFAACYFLNPAVNYVNLFDFHAVSLATTFLLAAFYFILRKNYKTVIILLVLAGLTKEEVWVINALFGLYLIFISRRKIIGSILTVFSLVMFYILVWIAIPKALGGEHFALSYYSDYGSSPGAVIENIFLSPVKTVSTMLMPDRLSYLKQLFSPLGYLSVFAFPFLIFAGPDLGIDLLSNNATLHQIYYQYSSTVTPFIFISAIYGVYFLKNRIPEIPYRALAFFILIMTLISAYTYGPLYFAKKPQNQMFTKPLANRKLVDDFIRSIPADQSVSATNNLGSHLSNRRVIYVIPNGINKSDVILFLVRGANEGEKHKLNELKNDPMYKLIKTDGNFYAFKKN
jgi:uncharacterized membrane protein